MWWELEPDVLADSWHVESGIRYRLGINVFDVVIAFFLRSEVQQDLIGILTERCPFCGERHFMDRRCELADHIEMVDGIKKLGHRIKHCVVSSVHLVLPDGKRVCNDDGYFLGISV